METIKTPLRPITDIKEYLLDELNTAMVSAGLNKSGLARKIGVRKSYVTQVFNGDCTIDVIVKWLSVLGHTVHMEVK